MASIRSEARRIFHLLCLSDSSSARQRQIATDALSINSNSILQYPRGEGKEL